MYTTATSLRNCVMPPIKAVLFDLDDTLWPLAPAIERAEQLLFDWLREHVPTVAARFSIEDLRARRMQMLDAGPHFRFDMAALRHAGLTEAFLHCDEDCAKVDHALAVFSRARNAVDLYEDVRPTLPKLAERWLLGTVSNGPADLDEIGISHHFRSSIAAYRFGTGKPDPKIFHAACDALGVAPAETVYVGDDPFLDVQGSQSAGLRGVLMKREGQRWAQPLPDHIIPDAICTNMTALMHWLQSNSGASVRSPIE